MPPPALDEAMARRKGWWYAASAIILSGIADCLAVRKFRMPVPISNWGAGEWLTFGIIALTL